MTTARLTLRLSPMKACAMSRILPRIMLLISSGENRFFSPLKVTAYTGTYVRTLLLALAIKTAPCEELHIIQCLAQIWSDESFPEGHLCLERQLPSQPSAIRNIDMHLLIMDTLLKCIPRSCANDLPRERGTVVTPIRSQHGQ